MKTKIELPVADRRPRLHRRLRRGGLPIERQNAAPLSSSIVTHQSSHINGFTLVELLIVISIIGILAALTFPVLGSVKRHQYIQNAQAAMGQLETALNAYKDAFGFYPPDNSSSTGPMVNQLYYELEGTTNNGANYVTLDGSASIPVGSVSTAFGVGGFVNCSKPGSGEESAGAKNFIQGLKPNQFATISLNNVAITTFVTAVGGPDATYNPLGMTGTAGINPWRYKSSGTLTNNPGSYELWIQLSFGGKKYLVCNWNRQPQINNPLP